MSLSVVVSQCDPAAAVSLAVGLRPHFNSVHVTGCREDLRRKVSQNRPEVAVVELESSRLSDVESLHRDFPSLLIVCTHRIPDEEMWMGVLQAGAVDVCPAHDVDAIRTSILRNLALARSTAA